MEISEENPIEQPQDIQPAVGDPKKSEHRVSVKIVLLLIVLSVIVFIFSRLIPSTQKPSETNDVSQVAPTKITKHATTKLSVDSQNARISAGIVEVPIEIDTGENAVSAVELHLTYDPKLLTGVLVKPGTFYTNPMIIKKTINTTTGTIEFVLGSMKPQQGSGPLVTISGTTQQKTSITIHIDPMTKAAAVNETGTVLQGTNDGTVQIP
jgi:hypothetical protein